jgi:DNA polymerase-3 subunit delta
VVKQELARNEERKNGQKYALGDNKDFFKKLTSSLAKNEEFDLLTGAKLENWIKKETEENNAKIEPAAIRRLAASVGPDLWQMANEISKLALFCDGRIIGEKDINALVRAKIESDIFKTIDALAAKNKKAALEFLHRHLARGESEIYLLTMLIYQFRNLILVKDQIERGAQFQSLGKKIKMHPFVLRKTFEQSKGFTFPVLKKIYERLLEIDLGIKSGKIEAQAALDLVVGEIAG